MANSGTQNAAVLNFTLPTGAAGAAGPAGLTYRGTWSATTAYSVNDAVVYGGTTYIATSSSTGVAPTNTSAWSLLAAQGSAGPAGPVGPTGPSGMAPTITIASTATGAAGSQATVQNVGSATNVQLAFTIPQGAAGTGGGNGGSAYSTVHTVAASNAGLQVYSPLVNGSAAGDSFAVLGYLPSTCNLSSVLVYNSAPTDARFEIHTGTPGNMNVTAAGTCTVKANSATSCAGPGALTVGAVSNNFVSFGITSGSSAQTFLYTQFSCN